MKRVCQTLWMQHDLHNLGSEDPCRPLLNMISTCSWEFLNQAGVNPPSEVPCALPVWLAEPVSPLAWSASRALGASTHQWYTGTSFPPDISEQE